MGSGIPYHDAYRALLPGRPPLAQDDADLRRGVQEWAQVDDEPPPPAGLLSARRLHAVLLPLRGVRADSH